eukprot:Gb_40978 [translate_table: standard]
MELGRNRTFRRRRKPVALLDPSRGGKMSFASLNKGARRSRNKGSRERAHSEENTNLSSHLARDAKDRASSIDEQRIDSAVGTALFFSPSLSVSSNPSARNLFVRTEPLAESNPVPQLCIERRGSVAAKGVGTSSMVPPLFPTCYGAPGWVVSIERVESVSPRSNCSVQIESIYSAIHPVTSRSPKEPREASNISESIRPVPNSVVSDHGKAPCWKLIPAELYIDPECSILDLRSWLRECIRATIEEKRREEERAGVFQVWIRRFSIGVIGQLAASRALIHYHGKAPCWKLIPAELYIDPECSILDLRSWLRECIRATIEEKRREEERAGVFQFVPIPSVDPTLNPTLALVSVFGDISPSLRLID